MPYFLPNFMDAMLSQFMPVQFTTLTVHPEIQPNPFKKRLSNQLALSGLNDVSRIP